jgi:hypothetical protein
MKTLGVTLAAAALVCASLAAQTDLTGEWAVVLAAPRGALEYTMYLKQEGPRLSGYFQSEYGEIPVKGTINGDAVSLAWTMPDAKAPIDVTMSGTAKGDAIEGEANLAKVGKGTFRAQRTGS